MERSTSGAVYRCRFCEKQFKHRKNLYGHVRKMHECEEEQSVYYNRNIKCPESKCSATFFFREKLRQHIQDVHNVDMELEEHRFSTFQDFQLWKKNMEASIDCSYFMTQSPKVLVSKDKVYYYSCHRSGYFYTKVTEKKRLTSLATKKINGNCPSSMQVTIKKNKVKVIFWKSHFGHSIKVSRIPTKENSTTAESAPSQQNVISQVQNSYSGKDRFQYHILQKKDIQRIKRTLETEIQNPDLTDVESLDFWVKSCFQMENSPILLYRPAQCSDEEERSSSNDFTLIIMTEYQKHILLASAKKIVCVDRLHSRRESHYYVTIIYVMDEHNLAFPVAFCVSSKVDKFMMLQFFDAIKQITGCLETDYFMSDGEDFLYDAWREIMCSNSKWLWNSWYVDTFWRGKLRRTFKGDIEKRSEVYDSMRALMECQNETVFRSMVQIIITSLNDNEESKSLGGYFQHNYVSNASKWAQCHRKNLAADTSLHLEVLHRTLAFCTRHGFKRLDNFVFVLMKLVRDKILDRLFKIESTKLNLALANIDWCHKAGLEIPVENVKALSEQEWEVHASDSGEKFRVVLYNESCPEHCSLKCEECDVCVHMFSCSCYGNLINANLCEHIHAIAFTSLVHKFTLPRSANAGMSNEDSMDDIHTAGTDEDQLSITDDDYTAIINEDVADNNDFKSTDELFYKVLKKTHHLYKKVKFSKCNLSQSTLQTIIKNLNNCLDICENQSPVESDDENSEFDDFVVDSVPLTNISGVNVARICPPVTTSTNANSFQDRDTAISTMANMLKRDKGKSKKLTSINSKISKSIPGGVKTSDIPKTAAPTIHSLENSKTNAGTSLSNVNSYLGIGTPSNTFANISTVSNIGTPLNVLTTITHAGMSSGVSTLTNGNTTRLGPSPNLNTIFALSTPLNTLTPVSGTGTPGNKLTNTVFAILTPLSSNGTVPGTSISSNALNVKTLTSTGSSVNKIAVSESRPLRTPTGPSSLRNSLSNSHTHSRSHINTSSSNRNRAIPVRSPVTMKATARKSFVRVKK